MHSKNYGTSRRNIVYHSWLIKVRRVHRLPYAQYGIWHQCNGDVFAQLDNNWIYWSHTWYKINIPAVWIWSMVPSSPWNPAIPLPLAGNPEWGNLVWVRFSHWSGGVFGTWWSGWRRWISTSTHTCFSAVTSTDNHCWLSTKKSYRYAVSRRARSLSLL